LKFNGYSGHAFSITATSDQLSRLHPFLQSTNKAFSAVMITTKQTGETYLIIYATELGRMDEFQEIFQNMLNSVSIHTSSNNAITTSG
jgi:hypothetical protein